MQQKHLHAENADHEATAPHLFTTHAMTDAHRLASVPFVHKKHVNILEKCMYLIHENCAKRDHFNTITITISVLTVTKSSSRAAGRSSGGEFGSWVTSTQGPGSNFTASPAITHPGRTQACTRRTDRGAYLRCNNKQKRFHGATISRVVKRMPKRNGESTVESHCAGVMGCTLSGTMIKQ